MEGIYQYLPEIKGVSGVYEVIKQYSIYSIDTIISKLKYVCQDDIDKRYALWFLALVAKFDGKDTTSDEGKIMKLINDWDNEAVIWGRERKIDKSIFYEMKDTAETFKFIKNEQDKKDLNTSIKNLIELG